MPKSTTTAPVRGTRTAKKSPATRANTTKPRTPPKRSASAKAQAAPDVAPALEELRTLVGQLTQSWTSVTQAIEEIPRAADLQPLADHLYEFARTAPTLLASLRGLPEVLAPVERATHALTEIADGLASAHSGLQNAIFHLPRPSEYEPLAEPLRAFARLSPALIGSLESAPRLTAAVEALTRRVETALDRLESPSSAEAPSAPTASASPALLTVRLDRIAAAIGAARDAIRDALTSLPAPEAYTPVARQLKELASVSPSLMEWMREVPRLATPLVDSIDTLRGAADELETAFVDLELTRRDIDTLKKVG